MRMIIKVMSHPKTPLPTSSGSSLQQGKASTESSWTRFLINLVENIEDDDDADDHLCRRSLIDPGRWRAPARSSWSPFFIHKSGAQDGLKKSATPDKILGPTNLFSRCHNSALLRFDTLCALVGLLGTRSMAPGAIFNGGWPTQASAGPLYWFQRRPHPKIPPSRKVHTIMY